MTATTELRGLLERLHMFARPGVGDVTSGEYKRACAEAATTIETLRAEHDDWVIERAIGQQQLDEAAATIEALRTEKAELIEARDFYAGRYAERCATANEVETLRARVEELADLIVDEGGNPRFTIARGAQFDALARALLESRP